MKFKVGISEITDLISTVAKGAGNGRFMAITAYTELTLDNGVLSATCLDGTNFIKSTINIDGGEDGSCIVAIDKLNKLISKTTVDEVQFTLKEDTLVVKGNGSYKLPIVIGEKFPKFIMTEVESNTVTVDGDLLKDIFKINKYAVSKDKATPELMGYLMSDKCITADGIRVCVNSENIFGEGEVLLSQDLVNMIDLLGHGDVEITYCENKLKFKCDNVEVFGAELAGKEDYPDVENILGIHFPYAVELDKFKLKAILDRVGIFANGKDNLAVRLQFGKDKLVIKDQNEESVEELEYVGISEIEEFECAVDIKLLQDIISPLEEEALKLFFGNDIAIKLEEGNVVEILALMNI